MRTDCSKQWLVLGTYICTCCVVWTATPFKLSKTLLCNQCVCQAQLVLLKREGCTPPYVVHPSTVKTYKGLKVLIYVSIAWNLPVYFCIPACVSTFLCIYLPIRLCLPFCMSTYLHIFVYLLVSIFISIIWRTIRFLQNSKISIRCRDMKSQSCYGFTMF